MPEIVNVPVPPPSLGGTVSVQVESVFPNTAIPAPAAEGSTEPVESPDEKIWYVPGTRSTGTGPPSMAPGTPPSTARANTQKPSPVALPCFSYERWSVSTGSQAPARS
jgi:hypothetical protein